MKYQEKKNNRTEDFLARYSHRMELVRTVIGIMVLFIQVWLFFHLSK